MPSNRLRKSREDGAEFFCCNGHQSVFAKSEVEKLKAEVERQKKLCEWANQSAKAAREREEQADRRTAAARGQLTKIKNRVGNGACPCCRRSFTNLQRHMASKHPSFKDGTEGAEP